MNGSKNEVLANLITNNKKRIAAVIVQKGNTKILLMSEYGEKVNNFVHQNLCEKC